MSNARHTPGPTLAQSYATEMKRLDWKLGWHLHEGPATVIVVKDANGRTVATVPFDRSDDPHDQDRGRLIAAAPELLAALEALYAATPDNEGGALGTACMNARAAIRKAKEGQ